MDVCRHWRGEAPAVSNLPDCGVLCRYFAMCYRGPGRFFQAGAFAGPPPRGACESRPRCSVTFSIVRVERESANRVRAYGESAMNGGHLGSPPALGTFRRRLIGTDSPCAMGPWRQVVAFRGWPMAWMINRRITLASVENSPVHDRGLRAGLLFSPVARCSTLLGCDVCREKPSADGFRTSAVTLGDVRCSAGGAAGQ